jgi:hypothetical protein
MALDIKFEDGLLCLMLRGCISSDDLLNAAALTAKIEDEAEVSPHRIVDLSLVEDMNLNFAAMHQLAETRKVAPLKNPVKSAILAPHPVQYGFARMFQTINKNPQITIQVFTTRQDAIGWLKS